MKKQKKPVSVVKLFMILSLVSVILVGAIIATISGMLLDKQITDDYKLVAESASTHVAAWMDEMDEGDYSYDEATGTLYKGNTVIDDCALKAVNDDNEDMHHTIFWGHERVLSDIKNASGESVVGTTLDDNDVWTALEKEGGYSESNFNLFGVKYSVSYTPIKNGNEIVGAVFCGVNQSAANKKIAAGFWFIIAVTIVLAAIFCVIVMRIIMKKSKAFGLNLNSASSIAVDKQNSVGDLGRITTQNMDQINLAIEEITQAVTAQASHTEEIMGSMQEFGTGIDNIMAHVHETASVSSSSTQMIEEMKEQLNKLEEVSAENSSEISNISQQIEEDSQAVGDIRKIIDVISDIAFQITILSFNASVEAARAGEAGKGFAVVADSIKDLSDKTKFSLEEITTIIESVNEKMLETSQASGGLILKNDKVVEALADTKARMDGVNEAFEQISVNIGNVTEETEALVESKNQVVETVSSLAAMSEENAAMTEEIKATSDEVINATHGLLEEIERLNEIVSILSEVKKQFNDKLE